jgi:hypothetical protein
MLRITANLFSGRENPSWILADEAEARATLKELATRRELLLDAEPVEGNLGLRGLWIDVLNDDVDVDSQIGAGAYLPLESGARDTRARELAERLIGLMDLGQAPQALAPDALPLEAPLRDFLIEQLSQQGRVSVTDTAAPAAEALTAEALVTCMIELGRYNPGFWNNDANVRRNNNCYNYASNKRTDTFAQPGRGSGQMYKAITCPEVTRAALADGLRPRFNCFPDAERPRYVVALVVAPGPGFVDYHWYRKNKEGFWSHKPGGTAARNTDNSGRVIADPAICDRGPYTRFCGYFYTCRSQRIR